MRTNTQEAPSFLACLPQAVCLHRVLFLALRPRSRARRSASPASSP